LSISPRKIDVFPHREIGKKRISYSGFRGSVPPVQASPNMKRMPKMKSSAEMIMREMNIEVVRIGFEFMR
jgi:hypothetical protein